MYIFITTKTYIPSIHHSNTHRTSISLVRVECLKGDIDHGDDEDETVEEGVAGDFVPVTELQPRHLQQRLDQLHHGVVVWPEHRGTVTLRELYFFLQFSPPNSPQP